MEKLCCTSSTFAAFTPHCTATSAAPADLRHPATTPPPSSRAYALLGVRWWLHRCRRRLPLSPQAQVEQAAGAQAVGTQRLQTLNATSCAYNDPSTTPRPLTCPRTTAWCLPPPVQAASGCRTACRTSYRRPRRAAGTRSGRPVRTAEAWERDELEFSCSLRGGGERNGGSSRPPAAVIRYHLE